MKMEITEKKANPLYQRTEVYFVLDHVGESTPGGTPWPKRSRSR